MYIALSRFATGIKIDDLCTMRTQHSNCTKARYIVFNDLQLFNMTSYTAIFFSKLSM